MARGGKRREEEKEEEEEEEGLFRILKDIIFPLHSTVTSYF